MDINQFIEKRPFLYHLTDARNLPNILTTGRLLSARAILELSNHPDIEGFLRTRRPAHSEVAIGGLTYHIRDQRPISEVVLSRSLTHNWTSGDFIAHLNNRVFFWPTISRLERHFKRYETENPVILRFNSSDVLQGNTAEFCRLNSGATRCSSHWDGNAPERGQDTFQIADLYLGSPASIAEVTIPIICILPKTIWTSNSPQGIWSPN